MNASITLRPATLDDADLLLTWRNDPQTRAASHNTAVISRDEHLAWLKQSLAAADRRLLVAEEHGIGVGSVRADWADGVWQLSWTVAPNARGRGVATRMVALLAQQITAPIRAEIKAGNTASVRVAEQAGLHFDREQGGVLHYCRDALSP